MRKIFTLLCAALVIGLSSIAAEPIKLETVWNHSVNNGDTKPAYVLTYAWNVSQRSIAYYNGKIYIANNQDVIDYIMVVDATTGLLDKQLSLGAAYGGQGRWMKNDIAITEDGYAIIGSSGTGGTYMTFQVVDLKTETVKEIGYQVNTPGIVRADFFAVHGKYEAKDGDGACIVVAANEGSIVKIPLVDSEIKKDGVEIITSTYAKSGAAGTSTMPVMNNDGSGIYILARSIASGYYDFSTSTFSSIATTLVPLGTNSGGVYFEMGNKKYLVVAADNISQFSVLDVTDGVGTAKEVIKSTDLLGTHSVAASSAVTPMAVQTTADAAIIYVYSTNNGIAAYKFTDEGPTSVNEDAVSATKVYPSNGVIIVETALTGATIEVYTLQGAKVFVASASGSDELSLAKGIYIVKVGNDVFKVVL